jgi:hypothetical protein
VLKESRERKVSKVQ